ncbi:MAG: hypothetical protein JXQ65_05065 [Candidatus Marinimicrobia bacterium]|nr:hypothetical protein [Candidatus Neomarinimicrobiota bacterium]
MKKNILLGLLVLFTLHKTNAQNINPIDNVKASFGGLSYVQVTNGAGIGGFFEKYIAKSHRLGVDASFILARGENEYPVYNYYYGMYMERTDKRRLSFFNADLRYKKVLFVDKIANNFRPFILASAGPVIAFDPPNVPEISERFKNIKTSFSANATIGLGIDFIYSGDMGMAFFAGYHYLRFGKKLDPDVNLEENEQFAEEVDFGQKDFSSAIVRISITRIF